MVNYTYVRPKKAAAVKKWYEKDFVKREDLTAKSYSNATILPLKRFDGETLSFGRGGLLIVQVSM